MAARGEIRRPDFASQLVRFDGLRWGNVTPTNLDLYVEFSDRLFVFAEAKHGETAMPDGQKLALQRMVAAINSLPGKKAVLLVVKHRSSGDIDGSKCILVRYWMDGKWRSPEREICLGEAIEKLRRRFL